MDSNQCKVYLGWVNSQLRKKKDQNLITDMGVDMADGTILAAVIEVVAGEKLEVIPAPSQHDEKLTNVNQVLRFMKSSRIPMHPICAEEIVSGDLRSIMRLILALAARYRPNTVRQTSRHGGKKSSSPLSVVGYAQSAVTALTDARRNASIVVPKPKKPSSLNERNACASLAESSNGQKVSRSASRSSSNSSKASQSMPKSSSQDFGKRKDVAWSEASSSQNDAKYAELLGRYDALNAEREKLRLKNDFLQSVYSDVCTEVKILRMSLASLQLLLEGDDNQCNGMESSSSDADDGLTSADVASLKNQLNLSEEICSDVKEDLSRTRNECHRLQGAEVGLHHRLRHQQTEQFSLKAELKKSNYQIHQLLNDKGELERQMLEKDERIKDLNLLLGRRADAKKMSTAERRQKNQQKESIDNAETNELHIVSDMIKQLRSQLGSDNPCYETIDALEEEILDLVQQLQACVCTNCKSQITNPTENVCDRGHWVNRNNDGQSR